MTTKDFAVTRAQRFIEYMASFELPREQAVARLEAIYSPLIAFLREHSLLVNPAFQVDDWSQFVLMSSDLTDEGRRLYGICEQRWLKSVGRGKKDLVDLRLWKRELDKLHGMSH